MCGLQEHNLRKLEKMAEIESMGVAATMSTEAIPDIQLIPPSSC